MLIKRKIYLLSLIIISAFSFSFLGLKKLPIANEKVIEYVNTIIGTQVGVGECTDLIFNAQFYLKKNKIRSKSRSRKILPGDFIFFHNASFQGFSAAQHSAIVYEVITQKEIIIVHQNHNGIKTAEKLKIDLATLFSGTYETAHP